MSILIIDDHPKLAVLMRYMLDTTGYREALIESVAKVDDAIAHLSETEPSVIFLDNYIPPHRSFKTSLPLLTPHTQAPIILISGSDEAELGIETMPDGLAGYVRKDTMTPDGLEDLLDRVLGANPDASGA